MFVGDGEHGGEFGGAHALRDELVRDGEIDVASASLGGWLEGRLLDRARRARDLTALQYEKGATSLLDYLDAQRTYIAVNAEYLQDLANYWDAVFQLEAASATELL